MSSVVIAGDTSGTVTLAAPAVSGTTTITLPTVSGGNFVVSDSSGNVGIGTSSPSYKLDVVGGINSSSNISTASGNFVLGTNDTYLGFASNNIKFNNTSDRITLNTGAAERMRIDSSGNVLVGTTSQITTGGWNPLLSVSSSSNTAYFKTTGTGNSVVAFQVGANGQNGCVFINASGTTAGSITVNASTTAYNTSSDYRLKENIAPMIGALDKITQLKPVTYNWKSDGSDGQGFIAHELQEIVPDAVTGEKDAVDEEGNPKYQGVDTSFLVATLTAAIQELKSELDAVKAELATLKGAA